MTKKIVFHDRYSVESLSTGEQDRSGLIFTSSSGVNDLTSLTLLSSTVDTVRQLYEGVPSFDLTLLDRFDVVNLKDLPHGTPLGISWAVQRMGKASGYRYSLTNKARGLQILLGAYHHKIDALYPAPHLKIECSPHFLFSYSYDDVQHTLDSIASTLLNSPSPTGCAVHLALDVQGWVPPSDFVDRFVTRARTLRTYSGIDSSVFDLTQAAVIYGKNETFTFGKPNSLQVSVYDKSLEVVHSDKVDFFRHVWGYSYNPDSPVWRVEQRFHQSVTRELGNDLNLDFSTFGALAPHLYELWNYAMRNNRLSTSRTSDLISPQWQLFMQDAVFSNTTSGLYIHKRKKKDDVSAISRNIGLVLGNLTTLWARSFVTDSLIRKQLKALSFWPECLKYFLTRGLNEEDLFLKICKDVRVRRLTHKCAA